MSTRAIAHALGRDFERKALCLLSSVDLNRVRSAFRAMEQRGWGSIRVEAVGSLRELVTRTQEYLPTMMVIDPTLVSPRHSAGEVVTRLTQVIPGVPMAVCAQSSDLGPKQWIELRELGVLGFIVADEDTSPQAIVAELTKLEGVAELGEALRWVEPLLPDWCARLLRKAAPMVNRGAPRTRAPFGPERMADLWMKGASPEQLRYTLKKEGLPTTGWLIRWLTLLRAVVMLEAGAGTTRVAFTLGFASRKALDNYARRFTGAGVQSLTAWELRRLLQGAVEEGRP